MDSDCDPGEICNSNKHCVTGCRNDSDCGAKHRCFSNTCISVDCDTDSDCNTPYMRHCETTRGRCEVTDCEANSDCIFHKDFDICGAEHMCEKSQCSTDADCSKNGESHRSCIDNKCETSACNVNAECANKTPYTFCEITIHECVKPECTADADCIAKELKGGKYKMCNTAQGVCEDVNCRDNTHCANKQVCRTGHCEDVRCTSDSDCPQPEKKCINYECEDRQRQFDKWDIYYTEKKDRQPRNIPNVYRQFNNGNKTYKKYSDWFGHCTKECEDDGRCVGGIALHRTGILGDSFHECWLQEKTASPQQYTDTCSKPDCYFQNFKKVWKYT